MSTKSLGVEPDETHFPHMRVAASQSSENSVSKSCDDETMVSNETSKDVQDDVEQFPLFMNGLPKDFSSNVHLAALASLTNDDDDDDDLDDNGACDVMPKRVPSRDDFPLVMRTKEGGGKLMRRRQLGKDRLGVPYSIPVFKKTTPDVSVGEAQLFLKMWSLK